MLVHGAFADSSGWSLVATALQAKGYPVIAFSNPLRGPLSDGEYLRQFLSTITGPIVLVGHSYGGAVITNAATGNPNVKSLVYIAAYALAEGESVQAANALGGGHTEVINHLVLRPFPGATAGDADAYIDPAFFPQLFAQDLPKVVAQNMAGSQRPGALASLVTPSGPAAWDIDPELVHGRQQRPHHPARSRASHGRTRQRQDGRSEQLTRADDQPAAQGDLPHPRRLEVAGSVLVAATRGDQHPASQNKDPDGDLDSSPSCPYGRAQVAASPVARPARGRRTARQIVLYRPKATAARKPVRKRSLHVSRCSGVMSDPLDRLRQIRGQVWIALMRAGGYAWGGAGG